MKHYISSILIPSLLLQLYGCYSQKNITFDELTSETDDEIVITLNNSDKYFLLRNVTLEEIIRNPDKVYCIDADTSAGNLILTKQAIIKKKNQPIALVVDTLEINKNNVTSIQKNEIDKSNTLLLSLGIVIAIGVIVAAILYEPIRGPSTIF